jgi:hypothetical protein
MQPIVADWARADISDLAASGTTIVGDLAELDSPPGGSDGLPSSDDVARAAGAALALRGRRPADDD